MEDNTLIDNQFFKPTKSYREYMILDMVEKNPSVTQRVIADTIGMPVSMVNDYLAFYEKQGYLFKNKQSSKIVDYHITINGIERRKVLNISYLNASQKLYNSAKENIECFLLQIEVKGFKNILLYGAGEVAEILLNTLRSNKLVHINVMAVIDDDNSKVGTKIVNTLIMNRNSLHTLAHDGVLISSYTNKDEIYKKLILEAYSKDKIIDFFEI